MQFGHQPENGPPRSTGLHLPGQGAVLVTPQGDPIPPDDVVQELKRIDPALRIRWVDGAWGMSAFCIERRWRRNDPRWREVQEGRYPESSAFDTEGRFPRGARTGDMIGWLKANYGDRAYAKDPAKEADRIINERQKQHQDARAEALDRVVEEGTRRTLGESDHQRLVRGGFESAHPMVRGVDFDGPKRLIPVPQVAEAVSDVE